MHDSPILQSDKNCWSRAPADRLAVLEDSAIYFKALADVLEHARESVLIIGWDIHSKVHLRRGEGDERRFIDLLRDIARARPELMVRILVWDPDVIYAPEREKFQRWRFRFRAPENLRFVFDNTAPLGASQHQKIVVVDDQMAFAGGIDVTQRRWDTPEHHVDAPHRKTPYGLAFDPFHDMQVAVDGQAAKLLSELARWRWERVVDEEIEPCEIACDHWPQWLESDFEQVEVAVARTLPKWLSHTEVREVEQLFYDTFAAATELIYLESQYLSSSRITDALEARLGEEGGPEVVLVLPREASGWVEQSTMDTLRASMLRRLERADVYGRLRVVYPVVEEQGDRACIYVHAKLSIIDDRLLRVGSANLTNRSCGVDSECDVAVEATDPHEREAIARTRNRLIGHHLDLSAQEVAAGLEETGSLAALIDRGSDRDDANRRLVPLDGGDIPEVAQEWADEQLIDPASPLDAQKLAEKLMPEHAERSRASYVRIGLLLGLLLLVAILWQWTPLSQWADPRLLATAVEPVSQLWWAVPIALVVFTVLSVIAFPTSVLILTMGFVFGGLWGSLYALAGSLLSAAISFGAGKVFGASAVSRLAGKRIQQVDRWVADRGVWSVVVLRMVPVAPFGIVNLAVGASRVPFRDFMWGTLIGMTPGIVLKGIFGNQLADFLVSPSTYELVVLAVILLIFVVSGVFVARWVRQRGEAAEEASPAPSPVATEAR
ncbi:MAG: VTT domain-containing protein [Persicimonas sp.]